MIRIQKDGKYFEIEVGEKITTQWVSTVFNDEDTFSGSYTYPVLAPFTPVNCTLLENAQEVENRSARKETTCILEVLGKPWKACKLQFEVGTDGFELNCMIDNAEFAKTIKDFLLPDVFVNKQNGVFADYIYDSLSGSQQETLAVVADRAANPGKGSCVFYESKNDLMFGGTGGEDLPFDENYALNFFSADANFLRNALSATGRRKYFYSPSYYLHWVIRKVCQFLGFEASGDFLSDIRTKNLVIDNTAFIDALDMFGVAGCKLAPARHLPKITIAEFIKKLRSTFKLGIYFDGNERKAIFNYAPEIVHTTDAVDITGFTEPGISIRSPLPTGYVLNQAIDEADDLFKTFEYVKSFTIGDSQEPQKIENFVGTLFMTDIIEKRPGFNTTYRVPRKRMLGNGYALVAQETESYNDNGYTKNEFTFRVLNFVGIRYDSGGNPYAYATSDSKEPNGTVNPDLLSLWMGGETGLINTFLKQWYVYYLRTEDVELIASLPGEFIHQISPLKLLAWTTPTQVRMLAMINQVSFEPSEEYDDRIYSKIRVYPIYNQAASDVKSFVDFQPGEIENEGKIYVKFRREAYNKVVVKWAGIETILEQYENAYLDFFSDEACTKPRNVSNLPVTMLLQYRGANARNYFDQYFTVLASGTIQQISQDAGIDQTIYYKNNGDRWTRSYFLIAGADYIVKS